MLDGNDLGSGCHAPAGVWETKQNCLFNTGGLALKLIISGEYIYTIEADPRDD